MFERSMSITKQRYAQSAVVASDRTRIWLEFVMYTVLVDYFGIRTHCRRNKYGGGMEDLEAEPGLLKKQVDISMSLI